jgi:hypothetical protein
MCEKCGKVFDDGAREWPELRWNDKLRCLLPVPLVGILMGTLLCSLIALFIAPRDQISTLVVVLVVGIGLAPLFVWWSVRIPRIYRSIYRYKHEPRLIGIPSGGSQS